MLGDSASSVQLVPNEQLGRGYGAKDLDALRLDGLRKAVNERRPDLHAKGLALGVMRARLLEAEEAFRMECANGLGRDYVQDAVKMFGDEAKALVRAKREGIRPFHEVAMAELSALSAPAAAPAPAAKKK